MNWEADIVRPTVEGAGRYTEVQLVFLLRRLEAHPGALPIIAGAIRDMGAFFEAQADLLEAEGRGGGAEIISLQK